MNFVFETVVGNLDPTFPDIGRGLILVRDFGQPPLVSRVGLTQGSDIRRDELLVCFGSGVGEA